MYVLFLRKINWKAKSKQHFVFSSKTYEGKVIMWYASIHRKSLKTNNKVANTSLPLTMLIKTTTNHTTYNYSIHGQTASHDNSQSKKALQLNNYRIVTFAY